MDVGCTCVGAAVSQPVSWCPGSSMSETTPSVRARLKFRGGKPGETLLWYEFPTRTVAVKLSFFPLFGVEVRGFPPWGKAVTTAGLPDRVARFQA
ncbi:predicted protein [Plenodomus lingam JN3]|uniref:Predicted protein n=1 Tax=Leptosphaeria maculans (strain JN3 / isolate v23.1.3 / race Av1-4-5-6-7-8) TaxID=985895 RepID=E5A3J7_LEPMJ|nr:predicted protein [Plenodomus lingam JN3]CBX98210.1 predicted protein [Plenodomus lingam JN3]